MGVEYGLPYIFEARDYFGFFGWQECLDISSTFWILLDIFGLSLHILETWSAGVRCRGDHHD